MYRTNESLYGATASGNPGDRHAPSQLYIDRIQKKRSSGSMTLDYYCFTSSHPQEALPLFVAVHGIRRRALEQAILFAPFIDAIGGTLIAPVFGKRRFAGYQRLWPSGRSARADLALQQVIDEVHGTSKRRRQQVVMFGYSGGGQFVHRYAMAYPRQIRRMAVAAPGWFTFPEMGINFPQGLRRISALPDLTFDAARFLKIPTLVLVGENDVDRDKVFNQKEAIDRQQGRNRLERAHRWLKAMMAAAKRYRYDTPYDLAIVRDCGHSFKECMRVGGMGWRIIRFLYAEDPSMQLLSGRSSQKPFSTTKVKGEYPC